MIRPAGKWSGAEIGVLRGKTPSGIAWIFTKKHYRDYILAFDYRLSEGGNGSVGFGFPWRGGETKERPAYYGFECNLVEGNEQDLAGSLYDRARAYTSDLWRTPIHRPGKWNQSRIYVEGNRVVVYINRRKTADVRDARSPSGRIGFQSHDPSDWVESRNVRIKEVR